MRFVLRFIVTLLLLSALAFSQSTNATITGRVVDPSNSLVVDAKIDAISLNTNVHYSGQTNREGLFTIPGVPPGPYRIEASKAGFRTVVREDVVLRVQDIVALNFTLQVGSVAETVTVTGGAPMVETQSAAVSTVVDQSYVANMPLNGRSFQDLILLTPGVLPQTPQLGGGSGLGTQGEFSVNGQRTEENYYTVDGVSANVGATAGYSQTLGAGPSGMVPGSTALGTTQSLVSVDDLQEFRVQSSTYSAEYGRSPGGQFAFETKSGTNQWHATAFDYLRNGFFDAQDWFSDYLNTPETVLRQNDFGGTLGGPVRIPGLYNGKDKTFFFVSYEGLRLAQPRPPSINLFVPEASLRAYVQQNQPALAPVLNGFPLQTTDPTPDEKALGIAPYIASWSTPSSIDSTSLRFDHVITDKLRLFFRFSDTESNSAVRDQSLNYNPSVKTVSNYTTRSYTAGATRLVSPRLSNDLRLNYTSNETTAISSISPIGGSMPVDPRKLSGIGPSGSVAVNLFYAGPNMNLYQSADAGSIGQWNLVDTVSFSVGRHQFKFGGDYRRVTSSAVLTTPQETYDFFSLSSVQNNSPDFVLVAAYAPAHPLYRNFSAFATDEWKASSRLNLSIGLRWEVNPPPGVTQGLPPYTLQGSSLDNLAAVQAPLWKTAWFNFAPRLGAAYVLRDSSGWETVVRGGGGVFFDTGQQLGSQGFNGPGFLSQNSCPGPNCPAPAFPVSAAPLVEPIQDPSAGPLPYNTYAYGFPSHLQLPYTLHWNFSVEQALGRSQALTISYVGSRASRLLESNYFYDPNNLNTNSYGMYIVGSGGYSRYQSLQGQFNRRLSRGLTALGSYTWSHCIDTGSSNFALGYQSGNCDFDVRHVFTGAFSYDLPDVGHNRFLTAALHHWGVDNWFIARTAFPITLLGNSFTYPSGQTYYGALNLVPGQPVYLYGANCASTLQQLGSLQPGYGCPGGKALNPEAFTIATDSRGNPIPGNAPRNFARLFGAWQMNFGVRREFPIFENLKLQFRAEAFNIFNHPSFGRVEDYCGASPGNGCSYPPFGLATQTLASSSSSLNPLYALGGPRSMQFALKLVF